MGRADAVAEAGAAAPRGFRQRRVASLFTEVLGVGAVAADDDFFALGGDAASAARLLDVIAEDAGVRLPADAVTECPTVQALAARIARTPLTRRGRVVGYGTELPGRPLFCMIAAFQARAIARSFNASAGRPFYAVQQSGLEGRARVDRTIRKRARRAIADIRPVQPSGPYLIAGYSGEAYVAFEAARMLQEMGERVDLLAVIDLWAPVFGRLHVSRLRVADRWNTVCEWNPRRGRFFDARRRALLMRANLVESADRLKWRSLGRTAGVLQRPSTRQTKLFHELTRTVLASYRPHPVDIDVVVIRADDFGGTDWVARRREPDLSWHQIATGRIEVVPVAGDHISIIEGGYAIGLADVLAEVVRRHSHESIHGDSAHDRIVAAG